MVCVCVCVCVCVWERERKRKREREWLGDTSGPKVKNNSESASRLHQPSLLSHSQINFPSSCSFLLYIFQPSLTPLLIYLSGLVSPPFSSTRNSFLFFLTLLNSSHPCFRRLLHAVSLSSDSCKIDYRMSEWERERERERKKKRKKKKGVPFAHQIRFKSTRRTVAVVHKKCRVNAICPME